MYKYLSAKNPEWVFLLTKSTLSSFGGLYNANTTYDPENERNTDNLVDLMLDLVLKQERAVGLEVIRKNIRETNVHLFPLFAKKASDIRDKSFVEPLFQRLESEDNPHVYLDVVEVLIKYNDPVINNRIIATRKINKALTEGWGAESLDFMLKEHNIK